MFACGILTLFFAIIGLLCAHPLQQPNSKTQQNLTFRQVLFQPPESSSSPAGTPSPSALGGCPPCPPIKQRSVPICPPTHQIPPIPTLPSPLPPPVAMVISVPNSIKMKQLCPSAERGERCCCCCKPCCCCCCKPCCCCCCKPCCCCCCKPCCCCCCKPCCCCCCKPCCCCCCKPCCCCCGGGRRRRRWVRDLAGQMRTLIRVAPAAQGGTTIQEPFGLRK